MPVIVTQAESKLPSIIGFSGAVMIGGGLIIWGIGGALFSAGLWLTIFGSACLIERAILKKEP